MPTKEEVIEGCLKRKGGLCVHFNFFTMNLLKAIGYDVYLAAANYGTYLFYYLRTQK